MISEIGNALIDKHRSWDRSRTLITLSTYPVASFDAMGAPSWRTLYPLRTP